MILRGNERERERDRKRERNKKRETGKQRRNIYLTFGIDLNFVIEGSLSTRKSFSVLISQIMLPKNYVHLLEAFMIHFVTRKLR